MALLSELPLRSLNFEDSLGFSEAGLPDGLSITIIYYQNQDYYCINILLVSDTLMAKSLPSTPESLPPPSPSWFSIKEAAEYLQIGEPTLYRWMRDSKITFRKVGDSTRFLKQDLDAMVVVHRSEKDAGSAPLFCPVCHHDELVEGFAQSTGRIYFSPKKTKFWTFKTSNIDTHSLMCTRCGAISWFGDIAKLESLRIPDPQTSAKQPAEETDV